MTTARSTDLEVNLQFGEFSLRKQALAPVPAAVRNMPDLLAVFGDAAGPIQSVEVSATRQRRWLRLVGQRTDLYLWQPDSRQPPLLGKRKFPSMLHANCLSAVADKAAAMSGAAAASRERCGNGWVGNTRTIYSFI